jgi:uronate dehydrogenase
MSDAFRLASAPLHLPSDRPPVLVTGAHGRIGRRFVAAAHERYRLRLVDQQPAADAGLPADAEFRQVDLGDLPGLTRACGGMDTVVHLAADPSPTATWDELVSANIRNTYHCFIAAKAAGCRRVVLASSIHAVSGYPMDRQVHASDPVNPGDLYGVSKCFAEALARYMAEQEDLSALVVRIGAFQDLESARSDTDFNMAGSFCSHHDCVQLLMRCVADTRLQFAILHALSDNGHNRMDISQTRELAAFSPRDSYPAAHRHLPDLRSRLSPDSEAGGQESGIRKDLARARAALRAS